jgi:hypothetical protein
MKKILLLSFTCLSLACSAQWAKKDTSFHSTVNPYREIKKGVVLQSIGVFGFAATAYYNIQNKPTDLESKVFMNTAYGVSGLLMLIGTVYHIQGLNYIYKPNQSGQWSFKTDPTKVSLAMSF